MPSKNSTSTSKTIASTTASSTPDSQSFAATFFRSLFARIIAWLADTTNGIHDFYAGIIHSQEDHTQKLCVGKSDGSEVCVTGDQLAALLSAAAVPATPISVSSPASNSRDASEQDPSLDLTNSGNPDNLSGQDANPSPADAASTSSVVEQAITTDATSSLPIIDAPPLVPDYSATTTIPVPTI